MWRLGVHIATSHQPHTLPPQDTIETTIPAALHPLPRAQKDQS